MYYFYGNVLFSFTVGWLGGLLWVYPITVGLEKAILCNKRIDWLRAGRHPIEEVNQIEKEYTRVMSGKYEAPTPRENPYVVQEKGPVYDNANANMSNSNLHKRSAEEQKEENDYAKLFPDVEGQNSDNNVSTVL